MGTEFSYVDSFPLKEASGDDATNLISPPGLKCSTFGTDWYKIDEEVMNNQNAIVSLSLRYCDERKSHKKSDGVT